MYAYVAQEQPLRQLGMTACHSLQELRDLIHEREVLTGEPGRAFFCSRSSGLGIVIAENPAGFDVSFGDSRATFYSPEELVESGIGHAMAEGRLFTKDV